MNDPEFVRVSEEEYRRVLGQAGPCFGEWFLAGEPQQLRHYRAADFPDAERPMSLAEMASGCIALVEKWWDPRPPHEAEDRFYVRRAMLPAGRVPEALAKPSA
jgi:hypothetical protein